MKQDTKRQTPGTLVKYAAFFTLCCVSICCLLSAQEKPEHAMVVENRHIVCELVGNRMYITDAIMVNVLLADSSVSALTFSLPEGYQDFQILNGLHPDSLSLEKTHIVDRRKPAQGKIPVAFRYTLPIKKGTTELSFVVYQPTSVFYFLTKNPELSVTSEQLVEEGLIDMGEHQYHALSGFSFAPGEKFTVTIAGLAKRSRQKHVLIFASIVFVILIIIAAFLFGRGRGEETKAHDTHTEERKKILISIMALLDEKFENGDIGETVYHELRGEHKRRLERIIKTMGKFDSNDA